MAFIPEVLTKQDVNNTVVNTTATTYTGTASITTGYNSLVVTISSTGNTDSSPCGVEIQFSNSNTGLTTLYSDTFFSGTNFIKSYPLVKQYYCVKITFPSSTTFTLTSVLSTATQNSSVNTLSTFNGITESYLDSFGKLRTSQPNTLLDIRFPAESTGTHSYLSNNELVGNYASASDISGAYGSSKLVITANGISSSSYYISQSRPYCTYQPGKSLLFMMSAILDAGNQIISTSNGTNVYSRVGYFDCTSGTSNVRNGLYFEYNNSTCYIKMVSNSSLVYNISQTSWNIDKMNGTGPSGLTLDFSKAQLFVIDMEWLGVGRVRFGFYAFGRPWYVHQITNINSLILGPYIQSINLPISAMLVSNSSGSGGTGAMIQICSTVISEGGYNPIGKPFSVNSGVKANIPLTQSALIALRGGGPNYYHQNIVPTNISICGTSQNEIYLYQLIMYQDGNIGANTITWTNISNSSVSQYSLLPTFDTTLGNPIIVDQGYFVGKSTIGEYSLTDIFNDKILHITSNIQNVSDILVLSCAATVSTNTNVYATLGWQEIY